MTKEEIKLSFPEFIGQIEYGKVDNMGVNWAKEIIADCSTELYHNGDCTNEIHSCRLCILERELNDYYEYCKKNGFVKVASSEPESDYNQLLQESNSIINKLQSENEKMREALQKIAQYHYPESIFPPVTEQEWKDIHKMLQKKFNMPIDRLTGAYARILMKTNIEIAKEALK